MTRQPSGARFGVLPMNLLSQAMRQLRAAPGASSLVVLVLALGIGANTAIFSIVYGLMLRPLPYPEPDRLFTLWERNLERGVDQERASGPNYLDWRSQNTVLADLSASPGWEGSETFNLVLRDGSAKVRATYTSASLFSTLGVPPLLGRALLPDEDRREGNRVAVLGHGLWLRHFGGDTNILGRTLTLDTYGRREYTVVGVMPAGFGQPGSAELWLPLGWMGPSLTERRSAHWHQVIARLKPGITPERAKAELDVIQQRIRQANPEATIGSEIILIPLLEHALGNHLRTGLWLLWGVAGGVLLTACANVANLLLVRAGARQREMAIRLALGATRGRVLRQLLAEGILQSLAGSLAGLFVAWGGLRLFRAACPPDVPRLAELTIDGTVLGFTLIVALVAGLVFSLSPARFASRSEATEVLLHGARQVMGGRAGGRLRNALVVAQVAISFVLLAGAGLLLRSFQHMRQADRGFRSEHLLTVELDFSVSGFTTWMRPTATRPQVPLHAVMERLRALPGVEAVGAGSRLLRRQNVPPAETIAILEQPTAAGEEPPRAEFKGISGDWYRALGARLVRGRDLAESDHLNAAGAVLINESFARRHFPDRDPLGQHVKIGIDRPALNSTNAWSTPVWNEVVGVISDVRSLHPRPESVPEIYVSYWQWPMQSPTVLVRATGPTAALASRIRAEVKSILPQLPDPLIRTMDERVSDTIAVQRVQAGTVGGFAALALVLSAVGIFGVISCLVAQRSREIGLRLALGAQRRQVLELVLRQGLKLILVGLGLGLAATLSLTKILRGLLYEITPTDPLTLWVASGVLLAVALVACGWPACRAARLDPMAALREE